ncbi:helix-turn-helix domain-containing protein [Fodinibius sediminis]|uniref:HTH-type transcriptional regulator / antitoxin HigA n=1 Tax=Fodinibius sediminis TaxID=1214077 RepID=A0A521BD21_9BACT|nr:helix-turn-helix domain-containing protein [Fodinibius sediminis]SMO44949.1 HTH-type transcriptional regulator / antitoxin HigA [Fodinibius sediminis]
MATEMEQLKYTVIKSEEQYKEYCDALEELVFSDNAEAKEDEIELLTLLIEDWDRKHPLGPELDPVELIKAFMDEHGLNQTELAEIAGVGKSYISEILNYKKRMSKKVIRNIATHFKIQQSALNKSYRLERERVSDSKDESNRSRVFDISTGNRLSYEDQEGESEYVIPSQGELELVN